MQHAYNVKAVLVVRNQGVHTWLWWNEVTLDILSERIKGDRIDSGKSYCSQRLGDATCEDKYAKIYARFDTDEWLIQTAGFYRSHEAEDNTFGYNRKVEKLS